MGTQKSSLEEVERRALDWSVFPHELHAGLVRSVTLGACESLGPLHSQTGLLEGMFESMRTPPEVVRRGALSMTDPHSLQASQKSGPLDLGVISIHICRHRRCWKCFGTMKGAECGV